MSALIVGASAAVLGTGLKAYEGISQEHKANQIEKGLTDPVYNIPSEFYENREIARQMAQIGLPQQQYNNQVNNINQTQAGTIAALSRSANPGANLAAITRQGDNATNALNAEDAQARQSNQRYFIQQNGLLGNQELAKQQSDVFDKYTRNFNQMQAYRGAGQQNLMSSANDAIGLGMTAANYANQNPKSTPTSNPNMSGINTSENNFNQYLSANPNNVQSSGLPVGFGSQPQLQQLGVYNPYARQLNQPQQSPLYIGQGWGLPNQ